MRVVRAMLITQSPYLPEHLERQVIILQKLVCNGNLWKKGVLRMLWSETKYICVCVCVCVCDRRVRAREPASCGLPVGSEVRPEERGRDESSRECRHTGSAWVKVQHYTGQST